MSRGKLVNKVEECVQDSLLGFVRSHSNISLVAGTNIVVRNDLETEVKKRCLVTIISGGGSGHEPAHIGYVGRGMLSAAVCGPVFTSPSSDAILEAILQCGLNNPAGVLLIVKNYTGDRINFELAKQRAIKFGIRVASVLVDDDSAIDQPYNSVGRRGLAGVVLVHKIAGAMAESGHSLEDIVNEMNILLGHNSSQLSARLLSTVGFCITPCTLPGEKYHASSTSRNNEDEAELGLGIHGESGHSKIPIFSAKQIVRGTLEKMIVSADPAEKKQHNSRLSLQPGSHVALLVNNLGGTSTLETYIVVKEALEALEMVYCVNVKRVYVGHFVTSLDMGGMSLTVLRLNNKYLSYLDTVTNAPAWPMWKNHHTPSVNTAIPAMLSSSLEQMNGMKHNGSPHTIQIYSKEELDIIIKCIVAVCQTLRDNEERLNALDKIVGDGDCGSTLATGSNAVLKMLNSDEPHDSLNNVGVIFHEISKCLEKAMGGSSGGLWSLFFTKAASSMQSEEDENGIHPKSLASRICQSFLEGASQMQTVGQAQLGDRSCLDCLIPTLENWKKCLKTPTSTESMIIMIKEKSLEAAESTSKMAPRVGRSAYLNQEDVAKYNSPDPGAVAVHLAVKSVCECLWNLWK